MGFLDIFKKDQKKEEKAKKEKPAVKKQEKEKTVKASPKKIVKKETTSKDKKSSKKIAKKGSLFANTILVRPVVTERATDLGTQNQYVFEVASRANRIEVRKAIQATYGVDPVKVNIINVQGKGIRYGRTEGNTKSWKKAIIFLREGDKIELYEGT